MQTEAIDTAIEGTPGTGGMAMSTRWRVRKTKIRIRPPTAGKRIEG